MKPLLLLIVSLAILILLQEWRVRRAQSQLIGKSVSHDIKPKLQHPQGVLYYFYHPMCGPCRRMTSIIDQLLHDYPDRVQKFNIAENQELVSSLGIRETPTAVFIKNNKITLRSLRLCGALISL